MRTVDGQDGETGRTANGADVDLKLEAAVLPVADADQPQGVPRRPRMEARRRPFLRQRLPGRAVHATRFAVLRAVRHQDHRCRTRSAHGLYLIVSDIDAGRDELMSRGATVGEVFPSGALGAQLSEGRSGRVSGPDPDHKSYSSFATFEDPDGNSWLLQEVTDRLPGRLDPTITAFNSAGDLARALRRAETAHGEQETRIGKADPDWPRWYAEYMVREQGGQELPA
jgi:hypothetical protein